VEITLNADGQLIRAEESGNEEIPAFDAAVERVERQLVRFRSRLKERGRHTGKRETEPEGLEAEEPESEELAPAEEALAEELPAIEIVKTKAHPLKPMSPEEAVLQMEMVGHDFFMFTNGQTQQVNVVYRRQGGGYGLIEPTFRSWKAAEGRGRVLTTLPSCLRSG